MKQRKNTIYLGAFVMVALVILVGLLLAMGGRGLFTKLTTYRMYFNKSVKGLSVGAPLMFRGVRIGQVQSIQFANPMIGENGEKTWPIEVIVEIDPKMLDVGKGDGFKSNSIIDATTRDSLIMLHGRTLVDKWLELNVKQNGMCAQLQSLSMLTGQLYIELDFFGNHSPSEKEIDGLSHGIIPTKISVFERLYLSLQQKEQTMAVQNLILEVRDFIASGKAAQTLDNIYAASENLKSITADTKEIASKAKGDYDNVMEIVAQLRATINNANRALDIINNQAPSLISSADEALDNVSARVTELGNNSLQLIESLTVVLNNLEKTTDPEKGQITELINDVRKVTAQADNTFLELNRLLDTMVKASGPESVERKKLEYTMEQINKAAKAIGNLAESLQRNPQSLLLGE